MTASTDIKTNIVLIAANDVKLHLDKQASVLSTLITAVLDSCNSTSLIEVPLTDFSAASVRRVTEYMTHHIDEPVPELERPLRTELEAAVGAWDWNFVQSIAAQSLCDLLEVLTLAVYLGVAPLRDLCSAYCAMVVRNAPEAAIPGLFSVDAAPNLPLAEFPWLNDP